MIKLFNKKRNIFKIKIDIQFVYWIATYMFISNQLILSQLLLNKFNYTINDIYTSIVILLFSLSITICMYKSFVANNEFFAIEVK